MLSAVQGIVPLIGAQRNDAVLMGVADPAARGQFLFVAIAFVTLTVAFVESNFTVSLVAQHSHLSLIHI